MTETPRRNRCEKRLLPPRHIMTMQGSFAVVEGPFDQSQIPDKPIMFTCERVQMRTGPYLHANVGFKPMSYIPQNDFQRWWEKAQHWAHASPRPLSARDPPNCGHRWPASKGGRPPAMRALDRGEFVPPPVRRDREARCGRMASCRWPPLIWAGNPPSAAG
jgi:hypothetical protein